MKENDNLTLSIKDWDGTRANWRSGHRLCVTVISTNDRGTMAALNAAATLAKDLAAKIVLLKVEVVPHRLPVHAPPEALELSMNRQRDLLVGSRTGDEDVAIRICHCRDLESCLFQLLRRGSLVVIGGRRRWWSSDEERLEQTLQRFGHHVIFIDTARNTNRES
jgi:hypothetical protein